MMKNTDNLQEKASRSPKDQVSVLFLHLMVAFTLCLVASNILETKQILNSPIGLTGGLLVFPISYVINDIVAYEQWKETVGSFSDDVDVQALRMALCRMDAALFTEMRYMDLFQTTGIRFDMTNTHAATGIRCTHDRNLIKRYIRQSYEAL